VADNELIDEHAEAIIVELVRVSLIFVDFRRYGMRGSTYGIGTFFVNAFGFAKIDEGDASGSIEYEVGGFDVAVDKAMGVKLAEYLGDLDADEFDSADGEWTQHMEEFV
jgi:hypothetical protein